MMKKMGLGLIKGNGYLGYEFYPIGQYGKVISEIKTKNRYSLIQEILQVPIESIPKYNPTGAFTQSFLNYIHKTVKEDFMVNKVDNISSVIIENNKQHTKSKKCMLFSTGQSDLVLAANSIVASKNKMENLFNQIISCLDSSIDYRFAEYKLLIYKNSDNPGKFILDKKQCKTYFKKLESPFSDAIFIGPDFNKFILSKNIIKTKSDAESIKYVLNNVKGKVANQTLIINLSDAYKCLLKGKSKSATVNLNNIDVFIKELIENNFDDSDKILIVGSGGCDPVVSKGISTKEATPFIYYYINCSSKNLENLKANELLNLIM